MEQVNAVELYGPVFAFAIGISVGGYGFAWLVGQIIERTDSYELLGKLLAGEEEKQAFEREMKEELRLKEEEERLEAAASQIRDHDRGDAVDLGDTAAADGDGDPRTSS